jgi:hypothetical protein
MNDLDNLMIRLGVQEEVSATTVFSMRLPIEVHLIDSSISYKPRFKEESVALNNPTDVFNYLAVCITMASTSTGLFTSGDWVRTVSHMTNDMLQIDASIIPPHGKDEAIGVERAALAKVKSTIDFLRETTLQLSRRRLAARQSYTMRSAALGLAGSVGDQLEFIGRSLACKVRTCLS